MITRPAIHTAVATVALLLVTALTWWGSLAVPFTYDDFVHLVNNPGLQAADATLGSALFSGFQETRPLFNLVLFAVVRLGGDTPLPFHAIGLLLHLLATLVVFRLALRLLGHDDPLPALLAAALFSLHPLMAETVCYVNSLSGLLSATLYLSALLCLAPGAPRRHPRLMITLALLAGLGALLAKESAATLPLAVLLADLLFGGEDLRAGLRRFAVRRWPFVLLPVVVLPVVYAVFRSPHAGMVGYETSSLGPFVLTQLTAIPAFIGLWLWPAGQTLLHQPALQTSLWGWPLAGAAVIAALVALALWRRRDEPVLSFGPLFFLLALSPTNSLLPLQDFFSERFLYLPAFGLALAVAVLLDRARMLIRRLSGERLVLVGTVLLLLVPMALGMAAVARVQVWQDPLRLWAEAVAASPDSSRARTNLARELGMRGRYAEALAVVDPAVRRHPGEIGPRLNRAAARLFLGDARGAVEDYQHATGLAPGWVDPWEGLARAALAAGDLENAEQAARRARALSADSTIAGRVLAEIDRRR